MTNFTVRLFPKPPFGFNASSNAAAAKMPLTLTYFEQALLLIIFVYVFNWIREKLVLNHFEIPFLRGDASWFNDRPKNRIIIHSINILDGRLEVEKLREMFHERVIAKSNDRNGYFKLTHIEKMRFGVMLWTPDATYDIANHINAHESVVTSKTELQEVISSYISSPLPTGRPPWQLIIINSTTSSTVLFRFKHTVSDGIALARLFMEKIVDDGVELPMTMKPHRVTDKVSYMYYITNTLAMLTDLPGLIMTLFKTSDKHPLHGSELSGQKHISWSSPVDLCAIKAIKNREGATVNDVIVTAACEAISRYLNKQGKSVDRSITVFIPASLRSANGPLTLENHLGIIPAQLTISSKYTFLERLQLVKARFDNMKRASTPFVCGVIQTLLCTVLPACFMNFILDNITDRGTAIVSNVPGPGKRLTLGGKNITDMMFFVPSRASVGIGISIISYYNKVQIGIVTDSALTAKPWEITGLFNEIIESETKSSSKSLQNGTNHIITPDPVKEFNNNNNGLDKQKNGITQVSNGVVVS